MRKIIPNIFTFIRIMLTPAIVLMLLQERYNYFVAAACLFVFGAATDLIDGYLARKMDKVTPFGAFLDPLADKIFVLGLFAVYVHLKIISVGIFLIFVSRDFILTVVRGIVVAHGYPWQTSRLAKWKTAMQFTVLCGGFAVIAARAGFVSWRLGPLMSVFVSVVCVVALLTFYSACDYLVRYHLIIEKIMLQRLSSSGWRNASSLIATMGMYFFRIPAPGTVVSALTAGVGYFLMPHIFGMSGVWGGIVLGALFFVGWITSIVTACSHGVNDPAYIVIDECVGMLSVLFLVPLTTLWGCFLAFSLFRLFDVCKIFPVNFVEKTFQGGMGIMLDDLAAAGCTASILLLLSTIVVV